jgi:hypothetical protein
MDQPAFVDDVLPSPPSANTGRVVSSPNRASPMTRSLIAFLRLPSAGQRGNREKLVRRPMQPLEFLPFGLGCECGRLVVVQPDERHQPIKCPACGSLHGPFGEIPAVKSLPASDAPLKEMIRFADAYNPTPHFRKRWGENHSSRVRSLWERCVQAYQSEAAAPDLAEELLMCFAYDVSLGAVPRCARAPQVGVPAMADRRDSPGSSILHGVRRLSRTRLCSQPATRIGVVALQRQSRVSRLLRFAVPPVTPARSPGLTPETPAPNGSRPGLPRFERSATT